MARTVEIRRSFAGGEWSPFTDPRNDLDKYGTALRVAENVKPNIYGGIMSRPGTEFISMAKKLGNVRLVEFEFGTFSVIAEFGQNYIRFYNPANATIINAGTYYPDWVTATLYEVGDWVMRSGLPYICRIRHTSGTFSTDLAADRWEQQVDYEVVTPYSMDELDALQFAQDNNVIYITHPFHQPRSMERRRAARWIFRSFKEEWPAVLPQNLTSTVLVLAGPTMASSTPVFVPEHVGSRWLLEFKRENPSVSIDLATEVVNDVTDGLYVLGEWSASIKADAVGTGDYESRIIIQRSYKGHATGPWETIRTISSNRASIQQILAGTELEPCWLRIKIVEKTGTIPPGLTAEITASDPSHYTVVEITGYNGDASVDIDLLIEAPVFVNTPYWSEGAWSDENGWPRAVTLYQGRIYFGGTVKQPQTIWGSIINDYANFRLGSDDDMALELKAASNTAHGIQYLASKEALIVGTTGSEWVVGTREQTSLTPTNAGIKLSTGYGSAHIQPKIVQDAVLFVQATGRKVREFAYSYEKDGYNAEDLTLLAEHITSGGIRQISLQRNPDTILWAVRKDGQLIALTYERSQAISGWVRYTTQGTFESVCACMASQTSDESHVWVAVKRNIDGLPTVHIERFRPNQRADLSAGQRNNLVYSDSAVVKTGAASTSVTGLGHLTGKVVDILADGNALPQMTVLGGGLTLPVSASTVVVGLPYTPIIETTWLETNSPGAATKQMMKQPKRITMELWKTLGVEFSGNSGKDWTKVELTSQASMLDTAQPLFTGVRSENVIADAMERSSIIIRQPLPLPLNILSLTIVSEITEAP